MNTHTTASEQSSIQNGLVGFFDILGYKEIIKQNEIASVAAIIEKTFFETLQKSKDAHRFVTSLINQRACEHFVLSDSILVFLPLESIPNGNTQTTELLFASHCAALVTECFWRGLPVRGALAYGECYFKSECRVVCFAGKAIVEACELANTLDFSGCVVTSSGKGIFSKNSPGFFESTVHFNNKNMPERMVVLNNYEGNWSPRELTHRIVEEKFAAHKKGTPDCAKSKITNTLAFLETCKKRPPI